VEPLSDVERSIRGQEEFDRACIHLFEAEQLAEFSKTPNACIHSAYYAMYHAATAALFASGGLGKRRDVPKSHEHVVEHFGKLVANETGDLAGLGMILSTARNDRMVADYDMVRGASGIDAAETTKLARKFVDACMNKWSFSDSAKSELND
jgi:uncharacterized protein (UPF0332 family)